MGRNIMIAVTVVIGIILSSVYFANSSALQVPPGKYDDFAKCLTEKGVVMHGTDWCSKCIEQKALFGTSFDFVDYFNCDYNKEACRAAGVSGYPTWVIEGRLYPGKKPLDQISSLSGCELE